MASKTGWTLWANEQVINPLVRKWASQGNHRICVRVDDAPESLTRAELAKVIKPEWEVVAGLVGGIVCRTFDGSGSLCVALNWLDGTVSVAYRTFAVITVARPHGEAEWIKITD